MRPLALHTPPSARGDDGLTDAERAELAQRYVTIGAGRPMGEREAADMRAWLEARCAARAARER